MTHADTVEQDMVTKELRWDPSIDSANIGVSFDRGAVTLSGDGIILYANQRFSEIVRERREALMGKEAGDILRAPMVTWCSHMMGRPS